MPPPDGFSAQPMTSCDSCPPEVQPVSSGRSPHRIGYDGFAESRRAEAQDRAEFQGAGQETSGPAGDSVRWEMACSRFAGEVAGLDCGAVAGVSGTSSMPALDVRQAHTLVLQPFDLFFWPLSGLRMAIHDWSCTIPSLQARKKVHALRVCAGEGRVRGLQALPPGGQPQDKR